MRYTQPQSGPIQVDQNHPFGRRKWAAVHVHGQAPFGSASPVATFSGTARNDVGPIGRNLNIVAAGDYLSYGTNPGLQLSTQSGILIVDLPSVSISTALYVTSINAPMGGLCIVLQTNGTIQLQKHNVASIVISSNSCVIGINVIAWSYNSTTGRARIAVNGIITAGSSAQSLTHNTIALGRYDIPDGTAASSPHKQYLFAVSPDECLDDTALAQITKSVQSAWQLFKSPQRVMLAAAGGPATYSYSASGGFILSGTVPPIRTINKATVGGLNLSGIGPVTRGIVRIPTGGLLFSGAATQLRGRVLAGLGGIIFGGAASLTFTSFIQSLTVNPVGGLIIRGTTAMVRGVVKVVSGGFNLAGSAAITLTPDPNPATSRHFKRGRRPRTKT